MAERMTWRDDEGIYQPRIHSRRIRELYQIGKEAGEPLTVLLDRAIEEFVARHRKDSGTTLETPGSAEDRSTWNVAPGTQDLGVFEDVLPHPLQAIVER
jgi:hypothetical protein